MLSKRPFLLFNLQVDARPASVGVATPITRGMFYHTRFLRCTVQHQFNISGSYQNIIWRALAFAGIFWRQHFELLANGLRYHPFMASTRRGGGQALVDGGRQGPAPCGRPHRKLKLESTDVILSSSHAKKLVYFLPEFCLWTE